jgi:hypothetical protein
MQLLRRNLATRHLPLVMACCLWIARPAAAAVSSINPTADAFLSKTNGDTNYGAAGSLAISNSNAGKGEFQSVIWFSFSSVKSSFDSAFQPGSWTVQSVVLQLTNANPQPNALFNNPNVSGTFGISLMNGPNGNAWIEGTGTPAATTTDGITSNTLSNFISGSDVSLGTFSYAAANLGNVTYTFSLPAAFVSNITSGSTVSVRMFAADAVETSLLNSQNFTTPASRPLLTVTAVPEPATLGFLTIASGFCLSVGAGDEGSL